MGGQVSVLIVDDQAQTRDSIRAMLQLDGGFRIAGEAGDGATAVEQARRLRPDVVLMDINMPVLDGIGATQQIVRETGCRVVIISVQGEQEYLRRAMQVGARDYLVKPFSVDELAAAVRSAAADEEAGAGRSAATATHGQVVAVFATKGGVGKTTLAANLGVALGSGRRARVALLDYDLEFGALGSMFGLKPAHTIVDLCRVEGELTGDLLERVMLPAAGGVVSVLAAPVSPEQAAEVDGEGRKLPARDYAGEIIAAARQRFEYTLVDTGCNYREATLSALDRADRILLVSAPDIPTLHNTARCLDVLLQRLGYPAEKVQLVLNRDERSGGLTRDDVARSLDFPISFSLPADAATALWAANSGQPFVLRKARTPLADAVRAMAAAIDAAAGPPAAARGRSSTGAGHAADDAAPAPLLAAAGRSRSARGAKRSGLFALPR